MSHFILIHSLKCHIVIYFPDLLEKCICDPNNTYVSIENFEQHIIPNILTILRIMLTCPVTTHTCERHISVLNRVKCYNPITQTDERLTGLCLICEYREIAIDWNKVVNTFAAQNPKKKLPL